MFCRKVAGLTEAYFDKRVRKLLIVPLQGQGADTKLQILLSSSPRPVFFY